MDKDRLNRLITENMTDKSGKQLCYHDWQVKVPAMGRWCDSRNDLMHCPKCNKNDWRWSALPLPDYTSPERLAELIRWLKGEHEAVEVGCWNPKCVDGSTRYATKQTCPLCHGRGTIRLRAWTFNEFLYYAHIKNGFMYESRFTFPLSLLDPPALAGVIGEWLMTLAEKEG